MAQVETVHVSPMCGNRFISTLQRDNTHAMPMEFLHDQADRRFQALSL
jgi:hypothetical protein